jgi:SAM-dependent methyltransferase
VTNPARAGQFVPRDRQCVDELRRQFHDERAGITEAVLGGARDADGSPYQWVVEPLGPDGVVVDLASGSGPLNRLVTAPIWVGVDASLAELGLAAGAGAARMVRAVAHDVPLSSGAASAVICCMSLQILQPLDDVVGEVACVLRPGGMFVALLPASGPLSRRDRLRYAHLLVALRRPRLGYPNDEALANPVPLFGGHGLEVVSDERRRFGLMVNSPAVAEVFVRSLYLPGASRARVEAAMRSARRWSGHEQGIPLRRIVAIRRG